MQYSRAVVLTHISGDMQVGISALMWASDSGHKDVVEVLLAQKADVHVTDKVSY